jgi:hypothetical protein
MIWESSYWKGDLIKDAQIILRWSQKKHSVRQEILLEKKIFISAYSIRKLIEAEKIGKDFPMWDFVFERHTKTSKKEIDYLNSHRLEEHYDFNSKEKVSSDLSFLSNQIIHSYVFAFSGDEKTIDGFYVASDYEKEKYLYYVNLEKYINVLLWIGYSDFSIKSANRNPNSKSGFDIVREYAFNDSIPRKGLPNKKLFFLMNQ